MERVTFGLIVGTRGFFPVDLAVRGRKAIESTLTECGYNFVIPPFEATNNGVIETEQDARICAKVFKEHQEKLDGIIVILPNFGAEVGVIETLKAFGLQLPILVQACSDDLQRLDLAHRRDSFCGKISVCNNLYQYDIPFTNTALHTTALDSDDFKEDLHYFASVCRVVKGLKSARIGMVGARPDAFRTMRVSEKLLQAGGITVYTVDLSEILSSAHKIDNAARETKKKYEEIRAYGKIASGINDDKILKQARLSLALDEWIAANEIDACAVQCWNSVQENYGCAVCLPMSLLGERLVPCACETDVAGAVSMYALLLASGQVPALLDWNNNYGGEHDKCINTHCSNYPKSFMQTEPILGNLDVLGTQIDPDLCFGAVKGHVAPGPMTYARISTDDRNGRIKAYLGEGSFTDDRPKIDGGIAVCLVPQLQALLDHICQNGYEHHVAMARSHCARALNEAFAKYLGWDTYLHS